MRNITAAAIAAALSVSACGSETTEDSHHGEAHTSQWAYAGEHGPVNWGFLHEDYETCETGEYQSPIDLPGDLSPEDLPDLEFAYGESSVQVTNNGHTLQYAYEPGSTVTLNGESYELEQFHFHARSEHAIAGHYFPLEMHLVHRSLLDESRHLVLAVLFELGQPSATLADADWAQLPTESGDSHSNRQALFNIAEQLPGGDTYRYDGSLTTPPCSESIEWVVHQTPATISQEQLEIFTQMYDRGWRPVAPIGERDIVLGN